MSPWWCNYIGLPFLKNGRGREGLDCWGLGRLTYADNLGVDLPSFGGSYDVVNAGFEEQERLRNAVIKGWVDVTTEAHKPFDLAIFTLGGNPFHCGTVTRQGEMLHITAGSNAVVESYVGRGWQRRLEGVYRYER